ncbi:hypothetical protein ACQKGD_28595 [Peribacillus frigoritolerans]|nr:hypothetical protein [Peribacillus frigoritolerans]USK67024.1 hypothetical protein LIT26_10610 [Peribacillus frigoritolerans]
MDPERNAAVNVSALNQIQPVEIHGQGALSMNVKNIAFESRNTKSMD